MIRQKDLRTMVTGTAIVALATVLSIAGCNRLNNSTGRSNMPPLSSRLRPLFEQTKNVCFGRFLLTVPATATVVFGRTDVEYPVFFLAGEGGRVREHVAEQRADIEKRRIFIDKRDAAQFEKFGQVIDGQIPGQKLVFGSKDYISYSITSFVPVGGDLFIQELDGSASAELQTDIAMLNTLAKSIRSRSEGDIPTEPGMCIDGGFVPLQSDYETVRVGIRFKEFLDVHFSVEATKNQARLIESSDLEQLLQRTEKGQPTGPGSWRASVKYFRRGPRQLGDWKGFEVLARLPPQEHAGETHEFHFTSLGAIKDSLRPELDLQLDTGVADNLQGGTKPSITDEEAVALWDKLVTSIRVRPVGRAATTGSQEAPKVPLGERAVTGRTCTQTGWWECEEVAGLVGERRRLFKAGTKMPRITVFGKPGLWQKLQGQRPVHEQVTMWQLVDYAADEPPTPANNTEPPSQG